MKRLMNLWHKIFPELDYINLMANQHRHYEESKLIEKSHKFDANTNVTCAKPLYQVSIH